MWDRWNRGTGWVGVFLLLTACSAPAATALPPVPSSVPAGSAASSSSSWDQVLAAAQEEGQVTVIGQSGAAVQAALTTGFAQAYPGIQVNYNGGTGGDTTTKVLEERRAGQDTVDVYVQGTNTILNDLLPAGAVDPLSPYLVGPDDDDPSVWRGGHYNFGDQAGVYALAFLGGANIPLVYNTTLVDGSAFHSYQDLLNPQWKGKIAMYDPRVAGSGIATAIFLYVTPGLGKDFLTALFQQQDVTVSRDDQQITDWVAHGDYPIGFSPQEFSALQLQREGAPLAFIGAGALQEGSYLTSSWGNVAMANGAPHPNAAKVYLDWLLSKSEQEVAAQAAGYPSRRVDASTQGLPDVVIPNPNARYDQDSATEGFWTNRDEVTSFLKSLLGT